ncbi:MAG TPA: Gfo/Idh/MocA family oxidoreductase [Dehalococcoidia bacterium]
MERHHVGLIGCGNWGRHILRDLVTLGCKVTAVARSEASRQRAAEGGADVVPDLGNLPAVDGVVVATPSATHAAVVEAVLPLGVPVFVEKPLTVDLADAERIVRAAPDRLFVMDKWRYHPGVEALAEIARSGELGPVIGLRTTRVGWGNPHDDTDVVWHLTPHDLAIALEILGCIPEPRFAVAVWHAGAWPHGLLGVLGDGPWVVTEISARSVERRRVVVLHCRDGVAVLADGYADHVLIRRGPHGTGEAEEERRAISTELPLYRELAAFVRHLEGGPPPKSSAAEGLANVRAIAALRSLAGLPASGD